jgi:HD-like signal output (HDOD) protein
VRLIERSLAIEGLFQEPRIRACGGRHPHAAVLARHLQGAHGHAGDPESRVEDIGRIVQRDVALLAKILHLANSSFFGVARRLDSAQEAVSYLGFNTIKTLTLSFSIVEQFRSQDLPEGFSFEGAREHSLRVGSLARRMVDDPRAAEQAFLVGILHDLGKLILATRLPELYTRIERVSDESDRPAHLIERRSVGASHAEIGAYLLGLWGIPHGIVEGVLFHHEPLKAVDQGLSPAGIVHLADALVHEAFSTGRPPLFDQEYLAALGPWRSLSAGAGWRGSRSKPRARRPEARRGDHAATERKDPPRRRRALAPRRAPPGAQEELQDEHGLRPRRGARLHRAGWPLRRPWCRTSRCPR